MRKIIQFLFLVILLTNFSVIGQTPISSGLTSIFPGSLSKSREGEVYAFKDNNTREIRVRLVNDSLLLVNNLESRPRGFSVDITSFIDKYHYKWVGPFSIKLKLISTCRRDNDVNTKPIPPGKMKLKKNRYFTDYEIFPLLNGEIISFSEDYTLMKIRQFLLQWEFNSYFNIGDKVGPIMLARLEIGIYDFSEKYFYQFCDRKERNLTFKFINSNTAQISNVCYNKDGSVNDKYSFVDTYLIKPKKNWDYKITKLISTTRSDSEKTEVYSPLDLREIKSCGNIFPLLKNKTVDIITLDHRLLQIGEFTFFYKGVLEAIFLNAKFENDKQ